MFPTNSERLIGLSDAFSAFCLRASDILPTCSLYPQQKRAYSALHPQAWTYIYRPCQYALTECSPLDFRRSSIKLFQQLGFMYRLRRIVNRDDEEPKEYFEWEGVIGFTVTSATVRQCFSHVYWLTGRKTPGTCLLLTFLLVDWV